MAQFIAKPILIPAAGSGGKSIQEFVGRIATGTAGCSVAVMNSPIGWSEPGQTPEFDEITLVLSGKLHVDLTDGGRDIGPGEAILVGRGEWVRYSTLDTATSYVSVCVPAFSPDTVHRDGY